MNLGTLKELTNLREIWPHEALNFTPWVAENSYGHPHAETLKRIKESASKAIICRTDECGQITVNVKKDRISIRRYIQ